MSETLFETAAPPRANLPEFSVSEISAALKQTVEGAFPFVRVRGEVSGLKHASSGHIYFDLKDDKAVLNAIIWKQTARLIRQKPEAGLEVVCTGRITTYPGSSRYQIIVEQVELAGAGALMVMLEERKKKLAAEGLFAAARKRKLPFLPDVIGVVTSPTGAVIRDIMHRLDERFPRRVLLWAVSVQGERAAAEIAAAIRGFNALDGTGLPRPDVLIVARGGGSIEDLMPFNEEVVVRAAAESEIPLISAVGHETDTTLIDFAADRRAPTPTAAAEMAVPVRADLVLQTLDFDRRLTGGFQRGMTHRRNALQGLARVLPRPEQLLAQPRRRADHAGERLPQALRRNLQKHRIRFSKADASLKPKALRDHLRRDAEHARVLIRQLDQHYRARLTEQAQRLASVTRVLETVSYRGVLERGFALVRGSDGVLKRRAADIARGERLALTFADDTRSAVAGAPTPEPRRKRRPDGQGTLL